MLTLKKIAIAVTVPVILSTTWACSSGEKTATEHHVQTDTLKADSIAIHEILNPWKLMEKTGWPYCTTGPKKTPCSTYTACPISAFYTNGDASAKVLTNS